MSLDYYLEDKRVSWMDSIVCFGICLAIVTVISVVDTTTYRKAGTGEFLAVGNPDYPNKLNLFPRHRD